MKFTLTYETDEVLLDLEKKIIEAMKKVGIHMYTSGFNFKTRVRDMAFEAENKEDREKLNLKGLSLFEIVESYPEEIELLLKTRHVAFKNGVS